MKDFRAFVDALSKWNKRMHQKQAPMVDTDKEIYLIVQGDGFKKIFRSERTVVPAEVEDRLEERTTRCIACKSKSDLEMRQLPGMEMSPNGTHCWCHRCWSMFLESKARTWPEIRRWIEELRGTEWFSSMEISRAFEKWSCEI